MKIVFLTKELPYPINSGARMRSWHYVRGLSRAGHVHMGCFGKLEDNREGAKILRGMGVDVVFHDRLPAWSTVPSGVARFFGLFSPLPYAVLIRKSRFMKDKIREVVAESACEAVICDGIHQALNVPLDVACRKILDEHNVESTIIGRYAKAETNFVKKVYAFLEWLKFRAFENRMWKKFDEIHVCSEVDKIEVERRTGHKNVCVVPNGVTIKTHDTRHTTQGTTHGIQEAPVSCVLCPVSPSGDKPFRLVYSGLMGWKPNDDAALYFGQQIWPEIKKALRHCDTKALKSKDTEPSRHCDGPAGSEGFSVIVSECHSVSIEWFIVGRGPTDKVKKLAEEDESITVTGEVADVKPLVESADIVIVPLRIGSGTRLKILEAMAMSRPVVSTSIGCEGLDVTNGENIVIADTPEDFANAVLKLMNDFNERARIAESGRKLVEEKYDWELIEKNLGEIINGHMTHDT